MVRAPALGLEDLASIPYFAMDFLGKSLSLSGSQFPTCKMGIIALRCLIGCFEDKYIKNCETHRYYGDGGHVST